MKPGDVATTEHEVVIAGGGPTGLMLAGELALTGVDVVVVERRTTQHLDGSRAGGLHSRTLEVLDQRGIAERFISAGQRHPHVVYSGTTLDIVDFPTRHNYLLALWQKDFEPILADWVAGLGVPMLRGRDVVGCAQDDAVVDIELSDATPLRARYLVGCDGGRSLVRKAAGIDFVGVDASTSWMIAEVEMDEVPERGFRHDDVGTHAIGPSGDGTLLRVVLTERDVEHTGEPTIDELRNALVGVYGTDFRLRRASWISRFTDLTRQAATYRDRRVLLAGDAAHVHPPQGGQGLNTGVQDAVNLGWKLAQVVKGTSPESLLDTYHDERHPVGARVLHSTMAAVALGQADERHQALRDTVAGLLGMDGPRKQIVGMVSGLDIRYEMPGDGGEHRHPLVGRRMPDLELNTSDGLIRTFSLLHVARPVLLDLDDPDGFDISPWSERVRLVDAVYVGTWELPVLGEVDAPAAVLVRPDGYVAWAGGLSDPGLPVALSTWFGARADP